MLFMSPEWGHNFSKFLLPLMAARGYPVLHPAGLSCKLARVTRNQHMVLKSREAASLQFKGRELRSQTALPEKYGDPVLPPILW